MCLIALAWRVHPQFELVLAANRDEFHDRPAAAAHWWDGTRQVYGGRDLTAGGGWLALSRAGRLAAVTNVRRMLPLDPNAPSRGQLVAQFASGEMSAQDYARSLAASAADYAGYNLLLYDGMTIYYVSNCPEFRCEALSAGVHAVSNAALDTPWPKLRRLKRGLGDWAGAAQSNTAPLFRLLADETPVVDAELPDTDVGLELERFLAPAFIRGPRYGTRASSVVLLARGGTAQFFERRFGADGASLGATAESFRL